MGQLPDGATTLIGSVDDVEALDFAPGTELAYVTQTTLSVDDTRAIVVALQRRFPTIAAPPIEDICYATTNRQEAVKRAAAEVEAVIVVGRALRALQELGFQLIIGAPREKATAFEEFVNLVAYISTDPDNPDGVRIYSMTIQEALQLDQDAA